MGAMLAPGVTVRQPAAHLVQPSAAGAPLPSGSGEDS